MNEPLQVSQLDDKGQLDDLFNWFKTVGVNIEPYVWKEMTHDEILRIVPMDRIVEFQKAFPHLNPIKRKPKMNEPPPVSQLDDKGQLDDKRQSDDLFNWFKTVGVNIEPSVWKEMTHDEILRIVPMDRIAEFRNAFPDLIKRKPKNNGKNIGGKRNKSKKPKRRNSRSKRRKTVSKRRR